MNQVEVHRGPICNGNMIHSRRLFPVAPVESGNIDEVPHPVPSHPGAVAAGSVTSTLGPKERDDNQHVILSPVPAMMMVATSL